MPLNQFDISIMPDEPIKLHNDHSHPEDAGPWTFKELTPGPKYAGALAVEGENPQLECWQWDATF